MNATVLKDYQEILAAIGRYVGGMNSGSEMMKTAFHANAIINANPIQVLYDVIDKKGKTEPAERIDILDVVGDMACARVVLENCHGNNYIDFLQLLKTDDGWKIVSKVYQQY